MIFVLYAFALLIVAAIPTLMVAKNLPLFHAAARDSLNGGGGSDSLGVSVLIPARDEEASIGDAIESILANDFQNIELIVLDDHSTDRTREIVAQYGNRDSRVRLAQSKDLPEGWNGKQHACWQLAELANHDLLMFMDADVRLSADCVRRMVAECIDSEADLISGFPKQITGTLAERLLVPMMYFVLLGYLPLTQMRRTRKPEFGAGCGQLFMARRKAYFACGGHSSIQASRHDGLKLPRQFRTQGFMTDLFDASDIAQVRMYDSWSSTTIGLLKNADEGIANSKLIVVFTILLLGAAVCPLLSFLHAAYWGWSILSTALLAVATLLSFVPRLMIAKKLGHSWLDVILHPFSVLLFVVLQWIAFLRNLFGFGPVAWRGRT